MNKWNFGQTLVFLLLLSVSPASFAATLDYNAEAALHTDIELNGKTSIIVEYNSTAALIKMNGASRKALAQSLHQNFINTLPLSLAKNVSSTFSYVPGSVLSVNKNQLQEIMSNPLVKKVYQNKARRANLQESLNIVLPGRSKKLFSGKGQAVAIIDTGVDSDHDFFKVEGISRIVSEACYTGGGFSGFRELTVLCPNRARQQVGEGSGKDCTDLNFPGCDHGTHVAGIAAGNDGVANEANIIAIQVFSGLRDVFKRDICGTGKGEKCVVAFDSDIIKGLERVFSLRNTYDIAAVNMSLGGGRFFGSCDNENNMMTSIIRQLKEVGIATVTSSGNNGFSDSIGFPACITNAIAVGATSDFTGTLGDISLTKDERVFYSNHSSLLDILAPGTLIRSSVPGNGFSNFNGTSMASPHVAGGFAAVKAQDGSLTVETIEEAFKSVGPEVSHSGVTRRRLDIAAALNKLGFYSSGLPIGALKLLLLDDDN